MVDHVQLPKSDRGRSQLSRDRIISWRKRYGLPDDMIVTIPRAEERAQFPPAGYFAVADCCFKAGFRLPPSEEAVELIAYCGVPITQFSSTGLTRIMGLICFFRECQMRLTVPLFRELCEVYMSPGEKVGVRSNKKWLKFYDKPDYRCGGNLFGFVKNQWKIPEAHATLPERCRRLIGRESAPITCIGYDDTCSLANALHFIHAYVDEHRLRAVGLSLDPNRDKACPPSSGKKRRHDSIESTVEDSDGTPLVIIDDVKALESIDTVEETNAPARAHLGKMSEILRDHAFSEEENAGFGRAMAQCKRLCSSMKTFNQKCGEMFEVGNTWNDLYVASKDGWTGMQEIFEDFQKEVAILSARNERDALHTQKIKGDLLEARARLVKAEKELATVRLQVASIEGDLLKAIGALKGVETEVTCRDEETKALHTRISELPIGRKEADKIKIVAVKSYKESFEFLDERARYGEEIRKKALVEESTRTLKEEREESFMKGFCKGLRLAKRKTGCHIDDLDIDDVSEDDSNIEN